MLLLNLHSYDLLMLVLPALSVTSGWRSMLTLVLGVVGRLLGEALIWGRQNNAALSAGLEYLPVVPATFMSEHIRAGAWAVIFCGCQSAHTYVRRNYSLFTSSLKIESGRIRARYWLAWAKLITSMWDRHSLDFIPTHYLIVWALWADLNQLLGKRIRCLMPAIVNWVSDYLLLYLTWLKLRHGVVLRILVDFLFLWHCSTAL